MTRFSLRALVVSWALVATFTAARNAAAFCRATTCDPANPALNCAPDSQNCLTVGAPLAWPSSCVTVSVQADAAPKQHIDYDAALGSVTRAFAAWTSAACTGGPPAITVDVKGPISCAASEYNPDGGNANIVVFRENEWPYPGGEDGALGLTRVRFDPASGEIWDADIEVNAVGQTLRVGDPAPGAVDLDSLLTHEAGHLLGLAHTRDKTATMYPGYEPGTIDLRTLAPDDVAGICAIYPAGRVASTSCEPRHGYADLCGADQPTLMSDAGSDDSAVSKGCAVSSHSEAGSSAFVGALGALGLLLARRRRARSPR